ncbi:uracil-DNA glycosylase [Vibrio metschnikovii]|nr:uracil-DNA glycosylase [Vibrio metschnikovii]
MMKVQYHPSWSGFLTEENIKLLKTTIGEIAKEQFTPSIDLALKFLSTDLGSAQVVILGMDPYPQKGRATGRAFEDGTISSWASLKHNASLANILKLIYANRNNEEIFPISNVKKRVAELGNISPPNELFKSWESQGVLLLNTALTCRIGKSGSHLKHWQEFSKRCFQHIAINRSDMPWLLWGKDAQQAAPDGILCLTSKHPRLYSKKAGSFLAENHFKKITTINWAGT